MKASERRFLQLARNDLALATSRSQPRMPEGQGALRLGEDGLELAVGEAAQLILKAVPTKGIADGTVFPRSTDAYRPVDGPSLVANRKSGPLPPATCLWPMVGVAIHEGQKVLVVGPWFFSFDQLCLHGYLDGDEVQRLLEAAEKIDRSLYRVLRRQNESARQETEDRQIYTPPVAL